VTTPKVRVDGLDIEYTDSGHVRERGLPAVALCGSNTYGPGGFQPTPHGSLLAAAAKGKMPVYVKGMSMEGSVSKKPPGR
jgi:dihydroflavonol-4-reductase